MRSIRIRKFVVALCGVILSASSAFAAPELLNLQGRIVRPDGQPVENPSVDFTIQIRSPLPSNCVLYEETRTLNMVGTDGIFSIDVGGVARSGAGFEDTSSFFDVFDNSRGALAATTCAAGPYDPAPGDTRKLRIIFDANDGGGPQQLTSDQTVSAVPYAKYADHAKDAATVGGKAAADLVQVVTALEVTPGTTQSRFERIINTDYTGLDALLNGTSTLYAKATPTAPVSFNSQRLTSVADPTSAQDAATKNYADTTIGGASANLGTLVAGDSGKVVMWDGTKFVASTPAGDSTKLPLAGGVMTGSLTLGGDLNVGGHNILGSGHFQMNSQTTVLLGKYSDLQEDTMDNGLALADRGRVWYNTDRNKLRYWDGDSVEDVGTGTVTSVSGSGPVQVATGTTTPVISVDDATSGSKGIVQIGTGLSVVGGVVSVNFGDQLGQAVEANSIPNCTSAQKLERSLGPTFSWACVADQGLTAETDPSVSAFAKAALPTCGANQVLKSDGTSFACVADQGITAETDPSVVGFAKVALPTCGAGEVLKADGTSFSCVADDGTDETKLPLAGGSLTGSLSVGGSVRVADGGEACSGGAFTGGIRFNGGNLQFCDGTGWQTLGVAGAGISALTGDVTASGAGSVAATIGNDKVTFAKMQNIGAGVLIGNSTGSAGDPQEITLGSGLSYSGTALTVTESDPSVSAFAKAALPTCGAGQVLKSDGTSFSCVADDVGTDTDTGMTTLTGDVTATGSGSVATTIGDNKVTYAKMQDVAASKLLGNPTGSAGDPQEISLAATLAFDGTNLTVAAPNCTAAQKLQMSLGPTYTWSCVADQGLTSESDPSVAAFAKSAPPTCGAGQVLKSDGTSLSCVADSGLTSESDPSVSAFAKAALPTCGAGQVLKSDGTSLSCVADVDTDTNSGGDFKADGTVAMTGNIKLGGKYLSNDGGDEGVAVTNDGNVGVGVLAPDTKLQVAGTIRVGDGGESCTGGNYTGGIRYNGGNIQFCNGASWQTLGVAGAGISDLTGDVTASGPGSAAATIGNDKVTFAKMQNIGAGKLIGNSTGASADPQEITLGSGLSYTGATLTLTESDPTVKAFSKVDLPTCGAGQVLKSDGTSFSCVADAGLTSETDPSVAAFAKAAPPTCGAGQVLKSDGTSLACVADDGTDESKLPLGGGTMSGPIAMGTNAITGLANPSAAQDAATKDYVDKYLIGKALPAAPGAGQSGQFLRYNNAGAGTWEFASVTLTESDPTVKAFSKVDLPTCGAGQVLKSDGTSFSCVADVDTDTDTDTGMTTLTGDVTATGSGSVATTIGDNKVTYAKMQDVAASKLLGNPTGSVGDPQEISLAATLAFDGTNLTVAAPNCTAAEKLQMSLGPTYAWSCVADVDTNSGGDFKKDGTVAMTGNIRLGGKWLSNDGGDEGISIDDNGLVKSGAFGGVYVENPINIGHERWNTYAATGSSSYPSSLYGAHLVAGQQQTGVGTGLNFTVKNSGNTEQSAYFGVASVGSGNTPIMVFGQETTAGNYAERMRIHSNGNIGIGVLAPDTKLQVAGTIRVGDGGESCAGGNFTGGIRYNGGNIQFCNGASWQTLGVAGAGISDLTGDVTASGPGSAAATIGNDKVTFAKMQNIGAGVLIGNSTGASADPQEITLGTGLSFTGTTLNVTVTDTDTGITALTGDVTASGNGSQAATIGNDKVTFAKMQNVAAGKIIGNPTGSAGDPTEISLAATLAFDGTNLTVAAPNCTAAQKLEMSLGPTYAWSCVTDADSGGDFKKDGTVAMTGSLKMGGNTIYGDSIASGVLTLESTSDATKGPIVLNPSSGGVAIGQSTVTAGYSLDAASGIKAGGSIKTTDTVASQGSRTTAYASSSATKNDPYDTNSTAAKMLIDNTSTNDGVGPYLLFNSRNANSNYQKAYIATITQTGVGTYTPEIAIGQQTGATAYQERIRIDKDGNVGIGTTAPNAPLTVEGVTSLRELASAPAATSNYGKLYVKASDGKLYFKDDAGTEQQLGSASGTLNSITNINNSGTIAMDPGAGNSVTVAGGTASTNSTSGSLVVTGGVGVSGAINAGGAINATGNVSAGGTLSATGNVSSGGVFLAPLGSAGAPSYTFTGDTDTGIYSPGANGVEIATDGIKRFQVGTADVRAGNVFSLGLESYNGNTYAATGTGSSPSLPYLYATNTLLGDGTGTMLSFSPRNTAGNWQGAYVAAVSNTGAAAYTPELVFGQQTGANSYAERMRIDKNGRVGIGTTAPSSTLEVKDRTSATLVVTNEDPTGNPWSSITLKNYHKSWGDGYPRIVQYVARGTESAPTPVTKGMYLAKWVGHGYAENNGWGPTKDGATIDFQVASNWGNSTIPTNIIFNTGGTGTWSTDERMRIGWNGNVGIGTKAPTGPLSVSPQQYKVGTASQSGTTITGVGTTFTSAMVGSQFVFEDGTSAGTITAFNSATSLTVSVSQTVAAQEYEVAYTGLNVTSTGSVGIGTTSPNTRFDLKSPSSSTTFGQFTNSSGNKIFTFWETAAGNGEVSIWKNDGTRAVQISASNDNFFNGGNVAIGHTSPGVALDVRGDAAVKKAGGSAVLTVGSSNTIGAGVKAGQIDFTTGYGSYSKIESYLGAVSTQSDMRFYNAAGEAMRIDVSGNLLVGTTTASGNKLDVNGNVLASAYLYSSDKRLKKDIVPLEYSLDKILKLSAVNFNWRAPLNPDENRKQIGLIAQEVEKVYPEAVVKGKDGFLKVNYVALIAPVIDAIRELYKKVMGIDSRVQALEKQVAELKAENARLKESEERMKAFEERLSKLESSSNGRKPASK